MSGHSTINEMILDNVADILIDTIDQLLAAKITADDARTARECAWHMRAMAIRAQSMTPDRTA
jgi:hypothetical protein